MARTAGRKSKSILILVLAVIVIAVVATQSSWLNRGTGPIEVSHPGYYSVIRYDDGDTIAVDMNGAVETVRFIGIDTPETHDPRKPVQCYGQIASVYTQNLIAKFGKVRLQADPLDTNRDRYGRLLRYVYLPDGTLMNGLLIKNGYGFAYLGFPFGKASQFASYQADAQRAKVGLWSACQPTINEFGGYSSNPI